MNPSTEVSRLISSARVLMILLAFAVWSAPLRAQEPSAGGDGARAIERGREGIELYKRGNWSDALQRFSEAEALFHSPVFVLYMARSLRNGGRLLEARATLMRLISERLQPSAPELWKKAQADGRQELEELSGKIPSVIIVIEGGSANTRTTVDDRPVTAGEVMEIDPGAHRIVAIDSGRSKSSAFTVAPGARRQRFVVQLARSNAPLLTGSIESEQPKARRLYVPGLVVVGIGGSAIVAGGVIGVLALRKKADVRDSLPAGCDGTTCPRSNEREIEDRIAAARELGTVADVLLIGGTAVAATGVGLLLFSPSETPVVAAGASHRGGFVRVRF